MARANANRSCSFNPISAVHQQIMGGGEEPDSAITMPAAIDGMVFRPRCVIGRAALALHLMILEFVFRDADLARMIVAFWRTGS